MKAYLVRIMAAIAALTAVSQAAYTINFGSDVYGDLVDSNGSKLDNSYHFELGAFAPGFVPSAANINLWLDNWYVFARASYNPTFSHFTLSVQMTDNGLSDNPWLTPGAPSFELKEAYLWIFNNNTTNPGSEWLVTRATNWTFPAAGACCGGQPLEWSVSDLKPEDVPLHGKQGDTAGPGIFTDSRSHLLQTYTFVPEPSAVLLATLGGLTLVLRRRRDDT